MKLATISSRVSALSATLLALGGCAQVLTPLGSDKFDCNRKEDPASPYCRSFKAVERGTSSSVPASRFDETLRLAEHDKLTGIAPASSERRATSEPSPGRAADSVGGGGLAPGSDVADAATLAALQGRPVRQAPLVQRVWVKRFADGNDMLVASTYVYKEILPTRWSGVLSAGRAEGAAKGDARGTFPHRPAAPALAPGARCGTPSRAGDDAACATPANDAGAVPSQVQLPDSPAEGQSAGSMPR